VSQESERKRSTDAPGAPAAAEPRRTLVIAAVWEELESTNEEMQSTNEELQSSAEELKSVDEDLVGKGATFMVTLPVEAGPDKTRAPGKEQDQGHRRVLVIDDNADAADTLKDVLELGGHEVDVAYAGREGLEKAHAFKPELVLCDIGLPEMDGYEVAKEVRADPELRDVTLVALTGYAGPEEVARAKQAGFDGHLAKPATVESLERTLREVRH